MFRLRWVGFLAAVCVLACSSAAVAQQWAADMFEVKRHDFGTIARGSKAVYEFRLKNIYVSDVHIASVRASCGCTSVSIKDDQRLLKTYEQGAVLASINSGTFLGSKGATITVTFDRPYYAEAQLQVSVYVRSDVALQPGSVQFGSVAEGTAAERLVALSADGGGSFRIVEVRSGNPHLSGTATATGGSWGQASYQLRVLMDANAPAGYVHEHLTLITNDPQMPQLPVLVEGRVTPAMVISPNWLLLGALEPGQKVTKRVVVQGREPFAIKRMWTEGDEFQFDLSAAQEPKKLHVVPVTFTAGNTPGKLSRTIRIETDRPEMAGQLAAQAVVSAPEAVLVGHTEPAPSPLVNTGR